MKIIKSAAVALGLVACMATSVAASSVTFNFTSTVTEDQVGGGTIGSTASGTLNFDTTPLTQSLSTGPNSTDFYTTNGSLSMTVGSNTWTSSGPLQIQIRDDWAVGAAGFYDAFIVMGTGPTGPLVGGNAASLVQLSLITEFLPSAPSVISGNGLPSSLDITDYNQNSFSTYLTTLFNTTGGAQTYAGRIFSRQLQPVVEPVPLPAGGVLLLSGFAIAAGVARRKRKAV